MPFPIGIKKLTEHINEIKKNHVHITKLPDSYLCFSKPKIKDFPSSILDIDEFNLLVRGEYNIDNLYYSTINPTDLYIPYIEANMKKLLI